MASGKHKKNKKSNKPIVHTHSVPVPTTQVSEKESLRHRIFEIIQIGKLSDPISRAFDIGLAATIIINIVVMFLETFDELAPFMPLLRGIEATTILLFCIEYALRIWTADYLFPHETRRGAIRHFLFSFDGIVDLLTILPFFFLTGFIAFRMLRVVRIFHLFRINAQYDSFNVITSVIYEKRNQLLSSLFIIIVMILASSLCMYSVEHEAQPENFKNAFTGIWWSVSTVLTVGYGDVYPVTALGRLMAIVIAFLGVGVVAVPTGIISAGFVEQYTKAQVSSDGLESSMQTVVVDIDSRWIGLSVKEVEDNFDYIIVLIRRGSLYIRPNDQYRVAMKDSLVVFKDSDES